MNSAANIKACSSRSKQRTIVAPSKRSGRSHGCLARTSSPSSQPSSEPVEDSSLSSSSLENFFTVDDALDSLGFGAFQLLLLLYAGCAWMAESMEVMLLGFIGPAVAADAGLGFQALGGLDEESLLSSSVFVGMMLGAYLWGFLSDQKGRRFSFSITAILLLSASLLSAIAPSYWLLLLSRMLVGVGLGGAPVVFALFLEFVPAASRGFWMLVLSGFWSVGSIVEALLAVTILPHFGWRYLILVSSTPLLLLLLFLPLLPESPRFLLSSGSPEAALQTLASVARVNSMPLLLGSFSWPSSSSTSSSRRASVPPSAGEAEDGIQKPLLERDARAVTDTDHLLLQGVEQAQQQQQQQEQSGPQLASSSSPSLREAHDLELCAPSAAVTPNLTLCNLQLSKSVSASFGSPNGEPSNTEPSSSLEVLKSLLSPPLLRSTLLLCLVFFANAFTYYGLVLLTTQLGTGAAADACSQSGTSMWKGAADAGVAGSQLQEALLTSFAEMPGLLLAAALVDRIGRKLTMGFLLLAAGLFLLALLLALPSLSSFPASLPTACLFLSRAAILGAFQIVFLYAPEVYPTRTRSSGLGFANSFSRLGGILCPFVAVGLVKGCQTGIAVSLFATVPILAAVAVLFFPLETNKRRLDD